MKIKSVEIDMYPDNSYTDFGDLDAGDMFISPINNDILIKLHEDTSQDLTNDENAVFIEDGTTWNFDDGDEVQVVRSIALEDE